MIRSLWGGGFGNRLWKGDFSQTHIDDFPLSGIHHLPTNPEEKMQNLIILIYLVFFLSACATQPQGGLIRPGVTTNPESYLETVGLDRYTKTDVLNVIGPPHRQAGVEGKDYWTYQLSDGGARARYTYIFEGETLINVRYDQDMGSFGYDGLTAREQQAEEQ